MLIRIRTPSGQKRLRIDNGSITIRQIKDLLQNEHNVDCKSGTLKYKGNDLSNDQDLNSIQFLDGDMMTLEVDRDVVICDAKLKAPDDVEDAIDRSLREKDGWTKMPITDACSHSKGSMCTRCMPVAPWLIQGHSPWNEMNIKHLPFHTWIKEIQYKGGTINQFNLQEKSYKIKKETSKITADQLYQTSITLESQPYRHVDLVNFESHEIIERFLMHYRRTRKQRCGFLIGDYVEDESIPLGIKVNVAAIYEPPQRSTIEKVVLLKDNFAEKLDRMLEKMNLKRVGFIWTSIKTTEDGQTIPDRDIDTPLKCSELIRMGKLQKQYPNPWNKSETKQYGSKFVSVLAFGSHKNPGQIDLEAYQVSDQGAELISQNILLPSSDPTNFKVQKTDDEYIYPEISYLTVDERKAPKLIRADPYLPIYHFIIGIRNSFPKNPDPKFKSFKLESNDMTWRDLLEHLNKYGNSNINFLNTVNDFELFLFIAKNIGINCDIIKEMRKVFNNKSDASVEKLTHLLRDAINDNLAIETSPKPNPKQKNEHPQKEEWILTLMSMGVDRYQAEIALFETGYISVEAAVNFLFG